jgi:1,2-diacylglycerol 3-beta-galactosyltransferase
MKRVVFVMSDTGGGHRAAAEAIAEALIRRHGRDQVQADLVDVFRHYTYFPLNTMPRFYPIQVKYSKTSWGMTFNLTNSRRRARFLSRSMYLTHRGRLDRLPLDHPADVVVSVHSVLTRPAASAYLRSQPRPPFLTVITDLVTTHVLWYDVRTELCLAPTEVAYQRGLAEGMRPEQLRLTGLPVHPLFMELVAGADRAAIRGELGWDAERPVVLMVAGGEGMGRLYHTARAIDALNTGAQLAIIAGKNRDLRDKLQAANWNGPAHIYAFVDNMPQMMVAADILVTKAGPATISEACIAGLPMIVSDALPGQERGNIDFVVENNAGVYAPRPEQAAATVQAWLSEGPDALRARAENTRRAARPDAVWDIADAVWEWAHRPPAAPVRK